MTAHSLVKFTPKPEIYVLKMSYTDQALHYDHLPNIVPKQP